MLDKETENKIIDKVKSTDGVKSSTVAFSLKLEKQLKEIRDFLNSRIDLWHDKINDLWYWRERQKEKKARLEAGESREAALKREIHEELDAEIEVGELLRTIDYDDPSFHLTMHGFKCKLSGSHVALLEHEAAKWIKPEELDSVKWLPADEEIINELKH